MVDVLLVGSGGREHALAWKLKQSPRIGKLYIAPGNGGTLALGENVPIGVMEFKQLADFAEQRKVHLTVVGPDDPLAGGIVDFFRARGLRIFGPEHKAAQLESSKSFSKQLMQEAGVPTATFRVFTSYTAASAYVQERGVPIVVKASGLALGKGVYVCETLAEAEAALRAIIIDRVHKDAGNEVIVEEYLYGPEVSVHVLSDSFSWLLFPPSQDHKRALDGDQGENTGGMGAIAPLPWVTPETMSDIEKRVVRPVFDALLARNIQFTGLLYPGLKVTPDGVKVLEFNARFGDPECQVYMRLLKSDILDAFEACADGRLIGSNISLEWNKGFAVNIVVASGGYPGEYKKGLPITGIAEAEKVQGVVVFHAGTMIDFVNQSLVTSGGRVLGVSAVGDTLKDALDRAYEAVEKIHFEGMHFRRDIGAKALAQK